MTGWPPADLYSVERFRAEARDLIDGLERCESLSAARDKLYARVGRFQFESWSTETRNVETFVRSRDCARVFTNMLMPRAEALAGFSVAQAIWDIARRVDRPDLELGFFAELTHLVLGLEGRAPFGPRSQPRRSSTLTGRDAAIARSDELDALWARVEQHTARYAHGLSDDARARRAARRARVLEALGGQPGDWDDWRWQRDHVITDADTLARVVAVNEDDVAAVRAARRGKLPFGVTPHYAALMDDDPEEGRDRAIRAQVLPPRSYVERMLARGADRGEAFDFMRERDTSPVELVTRRYPEVVILKPYNTCPQICVYCQRNWEIDEALACDALADERDIEAAIDWIAARPSIREVLVTGGDPLTLEDAIIERILDRVAAIPHVDCIRVGSRTLVTMPMRVTDDLAALLGRYREPGRRDVRVVTHVEHAYELTDGVVAAVDRLRRAGIGVYNQLVYTFYASRRFEATLLRNQLRRAGIDPYYTFMPKGKEETERYLVPLARILQERKEEARLLAGTRRTDEPVYNVPGLGKNHLRAVQDRDLVGLRPDGARVYEFHPWEKYIAKMRTYVSEDVPILRYLARLHAVGENPDDYDSIWYYY